MIEVSVLISTYNRAPRLRTALAALLGQTGEVRYEVIVIDNNSSDDTAGVVAEMAAASPDRIRYVFEGRQGKSHALNTGLTLARGEILAFTDDDVRVAPDWLLQFRRGFTAHPAVDYIGGRVLPEWLAPAPRWLTTAHWSPLALQDYGEALQAVGADRAVCLVGANIAYRRAVFARVGGFTPALGRTGDGIGSTEDHDLQLRMWRAGMRGLYDPAIVVHADVTADRLTREYHRRWHRGHGHHCALMRLRELVPADLGPMSEPPGIVTLFGTPAFVYLRCATQRLSVSEIVRVAEGPVILRQPAPPRAQLHRDGLPAVPLARQVELNSRAAAFRADLRRQTVDEANCPLKRTV